MKRLLALLLALALVFAIAACGKSPAQDEEEISAETTTITEETAREEASSTLFPFPELPSATQLTPESAGALPAIAAPAQATAAPATHTFPTPSSPAMGGTTATTKAATTTKPATTTTAASTTTTTATTATTTTTQRQTLAPRTFAISPASVQAMGLSNVSKTVTTLNDFGTIKSYEITGPRLKDVLAALGADMSAINNRSVLKVVDNGSKPSSADFNSFLINSNDTILALTIDGFTADAPRMFAAVEPGSTYSDSSKAIKWVDTFILTYN